MLLRKHLGTRRKNPSCDGAPLGLDHGVRANEPEVCWENHEVGIPGSPKMGSAVGNARAVLSSSVCVRTNLGPGRFVLVRVGEGLLHCSSKGVPPGSGATYNAQTFWNRLSFEEGFLAARERKWSMR